MANTRRTYPQAGDGCADALGAVWVNPHCLICASVYEQTRNGHRMFGHGGDTQYFHSDLFLMPDQNLGFFVSYNSAGRGETEQRANLFNAFSTAISPIRFRPA